LFILIIIEIVIFLIFKKILFRKLNDNKLSLLVCLTIFILLFIVGGFNGFFLKAAYSTENISFCHMVIGFLDKYQIDKDICILRIARNTQNELLCENLSNGRRDECYTDVALIKKDPNLCEKAGIFKEICRERVGRFIKEEQEGVIIECKEFRAGIKTGLDIQKGIGVYYIRYVQPPKGERYSTGPYLKFGKFIEDILYYYEKSVESYKTGEEFSEGEIVLINDNSLEKIDSEFNNIDLLHKIIAENIDIVQAAHEECFSIAAPESEYKPHIYLVDSINNKIILLYDAPILIKTRVPLFAVRFGIFIDVYQGKITKIFVYGLMLE